MSLKTAKQKNMALVLSAGFAMFSMFFGAGNLVYPLTIGAEVGVHYLVAIIGFTIAGVLVPFLGLLAIVNAERSYEVFFSILGKYGGFLIPLVLMLLIGPFGGTPRVITVAYGSFLTLFPNMNVYAYAAASGLIIYFLVFDRTQLVSNIGNFLTPFLLASLVCIISLGIYHGDNAQYVPDTGLSGSFVHSLQEGYQTMDLLATYFFAIILINYIQTKAGSDISEHSINRLIIKALLLGTFLLSFVYVAFIYLGSHYGEVVLQSTPDQALSILAHHLMGSYAAPVVCAAYILACLTTAVALVSAFSEFIYENIFMERIPMNVCIIATIVISCLISTLRFQGVVAYLGPVVQAMYPGLIVITLLSLLSRYFIFPYTKQLFYIIFIVNIFYVYLT